MTENTTPTETAAAMTWLTSSRGHLVSDHGHTIQHNCPGNVDHDPSVRMFHPNGAITEHATRADAMAHAKETNR